MEKIVVFGLGKDFSEKEKQLSEKYKIVAYTDNYLFPENRELFISPDKINEIDFDKVFICTRKYKDAVKCQLVSSGISEEKIADLSVLEEKRKCGKRKNKKLFRKGI